MKRIAILGSTGSIGTQTLDVVRANGDIEVVGIAAGRNIQALESQIREFSPKICGVWDEEKAKELSQKLRKAEFDYNDFLDQMNQIKKMGGMSSIMNMMPGMGQMKDVEVDEKAMDRVEAIILSMTDKERTNPDLMKNASRKQRVARGAGVDISEVNRIVKQFDQMKKMMKQLPGMMGGGKKKGGLFGKFKMPF